MAIRQRGKRSSASTAARCSTSPTSSLDDTISREIDPSELAAVAPDPAADTRLEHRDRVRMLRVALDRLAPTLRTAVMLRDIQELSYQEIAERLRLPEGTVKSRINRGRTELARQIQKLRDQQDAVPKTGVSG